MFQPDLAPAGRKQGWRDYVVPQDWSHFTAADHRVWDRLFARQVAALGTRIVTPFLDGLAARLSDPASRSRRLNARLEPLTGWRTVAVPGWCPTWSFSRCLPSAYSRSAISSARPTASTISRNPTASTTSSGTFRCSPTRARAADAGDGPAGGRGDRARRGRADARSLARVEFGLAREDGEVKMFGAGLASTFGEFGKALDGYDVERRTFSVAAAAATPYEQRLTNCSTSSTMA